MIETREIRVNAILRDTREVSEALGSGFRVRQTYQRPEEPCCEFVLMERERPDFHPHPTEEAY